MTLAKLQIVTKLIKDPFVLLIAVVVITPAALFAFGIAQQNKTAPAPSTGSREAQTIQTESASVAVNSDQKPITDAEQALPPEEPVAQPAVNPPAIPICDQNKRAAAENARSTQLAEEASQHERQKDKIRIISTVYRKYWDEEIARNQAAIVAIENTYKAALAAANCS